MNPSLSGEGVVGYGLLGATTLLQGQGAQTAHTTTETWYTIPTGPTTTTHKIKERTTKIPPTYLRRDTGRVVSFVSTRRLYFPYVSGSSVGRTTSTTRTPVSTRMSPRQGEHPGVWTSSESDPFGSTSSLLPPNRFCYLRDVTGPGYGRNYLSGRDGGK